MNAGRKTMPKRVARTLVLVAALLAMGSCAGDPGPQGPPGSGHAHSYEGTVMLADGAVGAGVLVLLHALDINGRPVTALMATLTDSEGGFTVSTDLDATDTWLGLEAVVGERHYLALLAAPDDLLVDPVSDGVARLVDLVAGPPGGRHLDDFAREEIVTLTADARVALAGAGTDLTDPDAVLDVLLAELGGDVADYSGGAYSLAATSGIVTVDPPDVATTLQFFNYSLVDGRTEFWDIMRDGAIYDGTHEAYDIMFELNVDGAGFPNMVPGGPDTRIEDGREVALGPVLDLGVPGLEVTRKIFVPEQLSFVRYAEILTNSSAAEITVDVTVDGDLGSDESTDHVHFSSTGDSEVTAEDEWFASHWGFDSSSVGFFFPGAEPNKSGDNVAYSWRDVTIPAQGTVVLFHWGFQRTGGSSDELAAIMAGLEASMPAAYFDGVSIAECDAGLNAGSNPNVMGEAGAVAPFATVTATNLTSAGIVSAGAAGDGSFAMILRDTNSGDQVRVSATDGTDELVVVP